MKVEEVFLTEPTEAQREKTVFYFGGKIKKWMIILHCSANFTREKEKRHDLFYYGSRWSAQMKYICPLIVVNDIQISGKFYEDVMGQKVKFDFGVDIQFEGDFSIHDKEHYRKLMGKDPFSISHRSNSFELYFEEDDIENAFSRIKESGAEIIHEICEQPWGQRVARFYDPDGHIIEIGESLESVIVRFFKNGTGVEEISVKTGLSADFVQTALRDRITDYGNKNGN